MPQQINDAALRAPNQSFVVPSARPPRKTQTQAQDGSFIYGEDIPGEGIRGSLPHRDIPHQEFPKVVYKHPKTAYRRMFLPVDGHGNKEWQWVANEATSRKVGNDKELKTALNQGFEEKIYIVPPVPETDPAQEPAA